MVRAIDLLAGHAWAIQPEWLERMAAIAQREVDDPQALADRLGKRLENTRLVTIRDSVALIPVTGPIFRHANLFTMISGATSVGILARDLREAIDNPNVRSVVLEFDSPGGEVDGTGELAELIAAMRKKKPIYAYADGLCCSGAYWLASACDSLVAAETARIGSIGVVCTAYRRSSDQVIEFVAAQSPDKRPDLSTEEGRAVVQRTVDDLAEVFVRRVAGYRELAREAVVALRGGVRVGRGAVAAGLADRVGTYEGLHARLTRGMAVPRRTAAEAQDLWVLAADDAELGEEEGGPPAGGDEEGRDAQQEEPAETPPAGREEEHMPGEEQETGTMDAAEVERLRAEVETTRRRVTQLEAANAALAAQEARRGVETRLAARRVIDGGYALAPKSRERLTDALMALDPEPRGAVLEAVCALELQPVGVLAWAEGQGEGDDVSLSEADRLIIRQEAKRKGVAESEVEKQFMASRRKQMAQNGGDL